MEELEKKERKGTVVKKGREIIRKRMVGKAEIIKRELQGRESEREKEQGIVKTAASCCPGKKSPQKNKNKKQKRKTKGNSINNKHWPGEIAWQSGGEVSAQP